jgi:hypothetical protein
MRNILKLHSGTQSGTAVSSKNYRIFGDFEKCLEIWKNTVPEKIFKNLYFSRKILF